ncbi:FkbM family methyltransferase [Roseiconus lacunae]|uniref:FkbM family methyltransferase n=1 Tax=Roseiconus lacunae TaxID=2605694 RepID=A0ABT7PQT5_9BACT|nr:FkbM family methyltransferase [Roseiconus lacunae]MDM4018843.1 FkbM family methyltransferase [Roseiconus lacunae]
METETERRSWQSPLHQTLRSIKKLCLGGRRIQLCDNWYQVPYEARDREQQDDYKHIESLAKNARCVFDIGANVGLTSLVMSRVMQPDGTLVAFEASEACCLVWRETMHANGYADGRQAKVINALIGSQLGQVAPFNWDFVAGNASAVSGSKSSSRLTLHKAVTTIDHVVEQLGLKPDVAKIDVEGAELDVIAGMQQTLSTYKPSLFIEVHGWPGQPVAAQAESLKGQLAEHGYAVKDLEGNELRPDIANDGKRMTRCWAIASHPNKTTAVQ